MLCAQVFPFPQDVLTPSRKRGFYLKSMQKLCGKRCSCAKQELWDQLELWGAVPCCLRKAVCPLSCASITPGQQEEVTELHCSQYLQLPAPHVSWIRNTLLCWTSCGSWVIARVSWIWVSLCLSQCQHSAPMKVSCAQGLLSFNPFYSPETALKSHKWSSNKSPTWKLKTLL